MNKEELEKLIALGYSTRKIASDFGYSQNKIARTLKKYGLKTAHKNRYATIKATRVCMCCNKSFEAEPSSPAKYCDNKCQQQYQRNIVRDQIRNNTYTATGRRMIYDTLCADFGNKCSLCGLDGTNWNGKPIRLWVDHIDGYANNNNYSNFRLVCPNCDSQLDTCRAKNKGKGRKSLGMKVY